MFGASAAARRLRRDSTTGSPFLADGGDGLRLSLDLSTGPFFAGDVDDASPAYTVSSKDRSDIVHRNPVFGEGLTESSTLHPQPFSRPYEVLAWPFWGPLPGSAVTRCLAVTDDPISATQSSNVRDANAVLAVSGRMKELAVAADEEGIRVSQGSRSDLFRFLSTHPGAGTPALFLLDNGNYRAMWWNGRDEQIGLQFRGNGEIQYVIFRRSGDDWRRSSGRDTFRGIESLIDAFNLRPIMAVP